MLEEIDRLGPLGHELTDRARAEDVLLVWRAQLRSVRHVLVRQAAVEDTTAFSSSGHGLQVHTSEGRTAFGSRDDFDLPRALDLLRRLTRTARRGKALGLHAARAPELAPTVGRAVPDEVRGFVDVDLAAAGRRLLELQATLQGSLPGLTTRLSYTADLDVRRVMRSDGTDVVFAMPRCVLRFAATSGDGERHSVGTAVSGPDPRLLDDERKVQVFLRRALRAGRLARDLPAAPHHPAGSFALVIDYALAKGLAHEAFGHAAEADGYRSSVLARDGRFRAGDEVGPPHVSIIDEPIAGDHAWQPYSADGVPRRAARIVDRGRLRDGLSDPWSAGPGGVALTGSGRSESFRHAPLPRMSNIRIEVADPLPAPGEFEDYGPEEVRSLLADSGVLRRHPRVAFLSGYGGGQVNTATGDFVFNCQAIYRITRDDVGLHKPAILSGSMFGALQSIREAWGPLRLDAIGTCGKWGQNVPSSGGSHYFLVVEPHRSVRLGGA